MKEYIVRLRYLSEDTVRVNASNATQAAEKAYIAVGAPDDTVDDGILESSEVLRHYKAIVERAQS